MDITPWGGDIAEIRGVVRISGTDITVDFEGTAAQIAGNINCPYASTVSAVQSALRCMLDEEGLIFNQGANRPLTVHAPKGSILNPNFPAAVRARLTPASRVFDIVVRALGKANPDSAVATGYDTTSAVALSSFDPEKGYAVTMEILGGGWGGACGQHGAEGLDNPISNCANAPVEALEVDFPSFRIVEYSLLDGSGGVGEYAGGRGIRRVYEATRDGVKVAGYGDRHRVGASGLLGGGPGGVGAFKIRRSNGSVEVLPNVYEAVLGRGDRLVIETGGGGGYGTPPTRG
ncbi:MAG: hydantoinase B/oxoprolinase family protein [Steroidobacteraceae bacterium]